MTSPAALPVKPARPEPTNACLRCGRPIPIEDSLCDLCNPLGLKQPAATQVHAIAAGGVVFFVLVLAVLAQVALSGVGPFSGSIAKVEAGGDALLVSIAVTNEGSKSAATTCRVVEAARSAGGPGQVIQTPVVPAGGSLTFTATVTVFGSEVRSLAVDCQSP